MSDVKHHVNAKTSILGRQYTITVTFDGSFLCHFEPKIYFKCHKMASYLYWQPKSM